MFVYLQVSLSISIHAPVKGATGINGDAIETIRISIHAPVKGATRPCVVNIELITSFQSTHP